jgi:hypothetical protein
MEFNPYTYTWIGTYNDGTCIKQIDDQGQEHLFKEIDQSRLVSMSLVPQAPSLPKFCLHLAPWQRIILFKRHTVSSNGRHSVLFFLGWQATIMGRNYKSVLEIGPDGVNMKEDTD